MIDDIAQTLADMIERADAADLVVDNRGRQMWNCPNCHRVVGRIIGDRLVCILRRDLVATMPLVDGLAVICWRCHTASTLIESESNTHAAGK